MIDAWGEGGTEATDLNASSRKLIRFIYSYILDPTTAFSTSGIPRCASSLSRHSIFRPTDDLFFSRYPTAPPRLLCAFATEPSTFRDGTDKAGPGRSSSLSLPRPGPATPGARRYDAGGYGDKGGGRRVVDLGGQEGADGHGQRRERLRAAMVSCRFSCPRGERPADTRTRALSQGGKVPARLP